MLYNSVETRGGRYKPAQATHQSYTMPASVGGINALSSVTEMAPTDCITCHNLVPSEYGMRLRKGYREWANGLPSSTNTLIAFEGQTNQAASRRLWAVCAEGIYDVTTYGETSPVQVVPDVGGADVGPAWTNLTGGAGYGNWTEMGNDAGNRYLFYADNENGIFRYDENLDIWEVPLFQSGDPLEDDVLAADIAYVMVWKQRLWMVERDSGDAWYLEPGAIQGAATSFNFGTKLQHGGELKALFNWTVDGGDGVDDILVAIGHGGDILGYSGLDPATVETFSLVASYYIGEFPASRNVGIEYGGELYLLSTYGVISVRQLLQGVLYEDPSKEPSAKINRFLRDAVNAGRESYVWSMEMYPRDGFFQIIAPFEVSNRNNAIQYVQNTITQAWGLWADVPINCAATWNNLYMMGTPDGRVIEYYGGVDDTRLSGSEPLGVAINYDVLTSFQPPGGDPTSYKRVGFIRPIQVSTNNVNTNVRAVYDYVIGAEIAPPPGAGQSNVSAWDAALWDVGKWDYVPEGNDFIRGTMGQGRVVAVAMRGSSTERLTFVGWDIDYTMGGFL